MFYLLAVALVVKLLCFVLFKLYSSLWKYAGPYELGIVAMATLISNGILLLLVILDFEISGRTSLRAPRSIFIINFLTDVVIIGGSRFMYRVFRRFMYGERLRFNGAKRVLIIGGGDAGALVVKELNNNPKLNYTPVAIIDDDAMKWGKKLNGVSIVGGREKIIETVARKRVDEIILAIPSAKPRDINDIYAICSKTNCRIKILPSVTQLIDESVAVQRIRGVKIEDLLGREPIKLNCDKIVKYIKGNVVMVTGAGGSIGSELCRQIAFYMPARLVMLDNYENGLFEIQNELIHKCPGLDIVPVVANIRERQRIDSIYRIYRPDIVFHAAAHKHVPLMELNPTEAIKNNVFGTQNVAECADKYGVKRFVLISTDKAVNPTSVMGATKRIAEMIIQSLNARSKTEFVAVRFGNVLGSNGSVIPIFKKQIENGGPVTVTHRDVERFFMTIPEAVQLVLQAGAMASGGEIFVLDMGEPVKIYDLARNLIKLSGFEPEVDIDIVFTGLRPGEKLYEELLLDEEGLQSTMNDKIFVAKPVFENAEILEKQLVQLREAVLLNPDEAVNMIKKIVPTFNHARNGLGTNGLKAYSETSSMV